MKTIRTELQAIIRDSKSLTYKAKVAFARRWYDSAAGREWQASTTTEARRRDVESLGLQPADIDLEIATRNALMNAGLPTT